MSILLPTWTHPDLLDRYGRTLRILAELLPESYPLLEARHHGPAFDPQDSPAAGIELFLAADGNDADWWLLVQDPQVVPAVWGESDPDGPDWIVTLVTDRSFTFTDRRGSDPDAAAVHARDLLLEAPHAPCTVCGLPGCDFDCQRTAA